MLGEVGHLLDQVIILIRPPNTMLIICFVFIWCALNTLLVHLRKVKISALNFDPYFIGLLVRYPIVLSTIFSRETQPFTWISEYLSINYLMTEIYVIKGLCELFLKTSNGIVKNTWSNILMLTFVAFNHSITLWPGTEVESLQILVCSKWRVCKEIWRTK